MIRAHACLEPCKWNSWQYRPIDFCNWTSRDRLCLTVINECFSYLQKQNGCLSLP